MKWLEVGKRLIKGVSARPTLEGTYAFLDTNIILEGRPLVELPWDEIDPAGPILVLVTPTVLTEVDSKKRDGRLATRAREFNRLIGPVASTGQPVAIRSATPIVNLTIAACGRIPWSNYDDLDPGDADSRIIAEVLHARDVPLERKVVVSHDINPILIAARNGLRTFHVSHNWIRPSEPSQSEKELQRLKARLAELQDDEPELHIAIEPRAEAPAEAYVIAPLSKSEQKELLGGILDRNPPSAHGEFGILAFSVDPTYRERYKKYELKTVPAFVTAYHSKLEILFNQIPIRLLVTNRGNVRADNLVVSLSVSTGWLNAKAVIVEIGGPHAPRERSFPPTPHMPPLTPAWRPGKHDMHFAVEADRSRYMEVHCEDFRNGRTWEFKGVLWLDSANPVDCVVSVRATAANMHGDVAAEFTIPKTIRSVEARKLIELASGQYLTKPRIHDWIDDALANRNIGAIEWDRQEEDE